MPAHRPYVVAHQGEDVVEFHIEGDLETRRSVYFTDQEPCFEITAENVSDRPVKGKTYVRTSYEASSAKYEFGENETLKLDLEPGEKMTSELCLDMLSYQGSAAVGINRTRVRDRDDHWEIEKRSGKSFRRVYTFMVYDRDYYKVNYLRPRRAQYVAAILAVLIVLVGVVQIGIFLGS